FFRFSNPQRTSTSPKRGPKDQPLQDSVQQSCSTLILAVAAQQSYVRTPARHEQPSPLAVPQHQMMALFLELSLHSANTSVTVRDDHRVRSSSQSFSRLLESAPLRPADALKLILGASSLHDFREVESQQLRLCCAHRLCGV